MATVSISILTKPKHKPGVFSFYCGFLPLAPLRA